MIRVDYAGPGGACEGLRMLGIEGVGIEWDAAACATRAAAGHLTIRADLSTYRPHHPPGTVAGYWSSPPCQTFSAAGSGAGLGEIPRMVAAIHVERWEVADELDQRTRHVIDAARTAVELRPEWIAMEQVPAVLPLWRALCHVLERHGYSTWAGVLNSADYGVPQTRRRAILMASRVRVVAPPIATHAEHPAADLFGATAPWVSMADALGWGLVGRPAPTQVCDSRLGGGASTSRRAMLDARESGPWQLGIEREDERGFHAGDSDRRPADVKPWPYNSPATTVAGDPRITARCHHEAGSQGANAKTPPQVQAGDYDGTEPIKLTTADALTLQSFPADYPVQGTKTKRFEQIGNAVPPLLAAHVVGALTGRTITREKAA